MVRDCEIHAEDERDDDDGVEKRLLEATTVETVESHGDECHSDERPFAHHCDGADEQANKVVVEAHPHSIGEEHGDHCERRVHKTGARGVHPRRAQQEEEENNGSHLSEESSHSLDEQGLSKRANEGQKKADGVEHPHLVSSEQPVHCLSEEGKRNKDREGAQSVLRATRIRSQNEHTTCIPRFEVQSQKPDNAWVPRS